MGDSTNVKLFLSKLDGLRLHKNGLEDDPKETWRYVSDSEFFDIVGEAFKSNPEDYMKNLYGEVRERVINLYGDEKLKEMEKYLLVKFSLYDDEQILFESEGRIIQLNTAETTPSGKIKLNTHPVSVSIKSGSIVVTNYRLIVQGKLKASGGGSMTFPLLSAISGAPASRRDEIRKILIVSSTQQELPCYGYQFPIQNHFGLEKIYSTQKDAVGVSYGLLVDNRIYVNKINLHLRTYQTIVEEQVNTLFKLLCKDANQVLNVIKDYLEMVINPKRKRGELLAILRHLRTKEEYKDISDSEYLDIVRETYRLNPQFFMDFLYPKMKNWESFILEKKIKEEFLELIENLNKEAE